MLDDTTPNLPALLRSLPDIVAEYDAKRAAIPATVEAFQRATTAAEIGATVGGTYAGSIWYGGRSGDLHGPHLERNLLESAWKHVYHGLKLDKIAPASDRSRFETALKDPAPFTLDNIRGTFGKYIADPRGHILRGLAECFAKLDPAFKSHDKMKIGVTGLPKRIILSSVTSAGYGGWGSKYLEDMLKALCVLLGLDHPEWIQLSTLLSEAEKGPAKLREFIKATKEERALGICDRTGDHMTGPLGDLTLKRFGNGNGHLFFGPEILRVVNLALAEYYGEVLADCPEARPKRAASTAVAKDLQFYRTPQAAADALLHKASPGDGCRILEPSCGDGAILDAVRRYCANDRNASWDAETRRQKAPSVRAMGIEVDAERAEQARAKGYSVQVANFLNVAPSPVFDLVLMNPPFYGKHYQKHVDHARKFLKPGGRLYAILPVTAVTDHGFVKPDKWGCDKWEDLPVGSFSESGTNINTGIAVFFAPKT
jgi:hypothetical protein